VTTEPTPRPDPPVPSATAPDAAPAIAPIDGGRSKRARFPWLTLVALLLAVAAAAYAYVQLGHVKREVARRFADLQQAVSSATDTAARADAEARAARQQAAVLEARLAEVESQRDALEQLYADLSRGRDDAVLVEVERLVSLAGQELSISGAVPMALAALQTADARLARLESPRLVPLRRVLARDIERLKSAPTVDSTGIALKLDQLINGVDAWPLLSEAASPTTAAPGGKSASDSAAAPAAPPLPRSADWWQRTWAAIQRELGAARDLIRIRMVESPESVLLTQSQQQLVRQQMKLRLLTARHAMLARNDRLYRADLLEAQSLMTRYFDTRAREVAAAVALVRQLAAMPLSVETPNINDSVAAVRAARTAPLR
jgi:uncharacterized protein HemX